MRCVTALLMASAIAFACSCGPPATEADVVGRYVYHSEDPAERRSDHERDGLVLNADHTYVLTEGGSTKALAIRTGRWGLSGEEGSHQIPEVWLDTGKYPISVKRGTVRLDIDYDTAIWFEKVK